MTKIERAFPTAPQPQKEIKKMTLIHMHEYFEMLLAWRDAYLANQKFSEGRFEHKRAFDYEIQINRIDNQLKALRVIAFG